MSAVASDEIRLSPFQEQAMQVPETVDLFIGGGRGGGKSFLLALMFVRHLEQYGSRARMLFVRQSFPGVVDFEQTCREVFGQLYGSAASYNGSTHLWRFHNGATLQLDEYEGVGSFAKYQGKSFSFIAVDEAGQYADPAPLDLLRSCLRARSPVVPRLVLAANPGGPGHGWIVQRHVLKASPWAVYTESKTGRQFVNAPSTYRDNPHLDQDAYRRQLSAACATDPELFKAWEAGDWSVARGAYFSAVLDESRVMVEPWPVNFGDRRLAKGSSGGGIHMTRPRHWGPSVPTWEMALAHDFGVSAPSVTYVTATSPGTEGPNGRYYPRGSVVLLDELATNEPGSLTKGMGYTVPVLAEQIVSLAERWGIRPEGAADDAIFARTGSSAGSIADEFRRAGVFFQPARKADRLTGWEIMRRMLFDADKPDVPGLYVARTCEYWWSTVPSLARDPKRPDDLDSRGPDHGADATRYALVGHHTNVARVGRYRIG